MRLLQIYWSHSTQSKPICSLRYYFPPVPNAKSISVLGKFNSKSRYQYVFRAMIITHLRLVSLGQDSAGLNPSAKINFRTGIESTRVIPLDVYPSSCATATVENLSFA